jgi:PAS domain S-box-containing protein
MREGSRFAPSLAATLALVTFSGVFLLAALSLLLDHHAQKRMAQDIVRTDAYNLVSSLRHPIQMLLAHDDREALRAMMESVASDRRVRYALLLDERQRILAAHRSHLVGREMRTIFPHALPSLQRAMHERRILCQPAADDALLLAIAPISITAERYFAAGATAALVIAFDMTPLEALLKTHLRISLLIYALNGAIFALLIFLILDHAAATPIRHLAKALRQIRQGDLSAHIRIPRLAELGELAHAFNEMTLRLRAYHEALKRRHRELEELHQATHRMKEQYRQLVELAQEGIIIVDTEETIRYVNPAFARLVGYAEEELIGRSIMSLILEEDHPRVAAETERRRRGESSRYEVRMRTKGGETRTLLIAVGPLWDEAGAFAGALAVTVDITELKQKEEALRRSEERYSDLYNNAPDGYHTLASDGTFVEINETELRWLGYRREEVIGRLTIFDVTDDRGRRTLEHALSRLAEEGTVHELELEMIRRDGTRFPVRMNIVAEFDERGTYRGCRATVRDITEQKSLEQQLLQAQKLEAVGALAGGIAHDFNNLLTGMLGFTELAVRELGSGDPRAELLQNVLTLGRRGAQLVRQLLSFSRRLETHRTILDTREFLTEMVGLLRRVLPETIAIRLDLPEQVENLDADPVQLQQVLMNLAVNARDAMPEGGTLTISCASVRLTQPGAPPLPVDAPPGRYLRLSVADTGVGMSPEVQAHIFEPFFTTKDVGKGSGLGLSVVYGIVRAHGGFITVQSALGQGSRFDIYLPVTERSARPEQEATARPFRGANQLILLADDEPVLLDLEEKVLRTYGYRVVKARNGREALRLYEEHRAEIALVVLDALMPEVTGIEVARRIREQDAAARILLVTGYNPEESGLKGMHLVNAHMLQKPYTPRQLLETIGQILSEPCAEPLPM